MGHDQLFKAILEAFLKDFLELFFPEVAERLDFKTLRPLDKEVFTGFPEGSRRQVDFLGSASRSRTRRQPTRFVRSRLQKRQVLHKTRGVACPQISLVGTARSPQIPSDPGFRRLLGSRTHCRGSGTVMGEA